MLRFLFRKRVVDDGREAFKNAVGSDPRVTA